MFQKLFDRLKPKLENKPTSELLTIWENNNQNDYTLRELEVVRQLLQMRNQPIPKQKEFIENQDDEYSREQINKLINGAMFFLLIFGFINLIYWFLVSGSERQALLSRFTEIKPLLWIEIYGKLIISILLILLSVVCFVMRLNTLVLLLSGFFLIFSGIWNLTSDLIAIPAFAQYNIRLTVYNILDNMKYFLYILGVFQIRWGYNQIKDYYKIITL